MFSAAATGAAESSARHIELPQFSPALNAALQSSRIILV
jgi:hypothetical protein